MLCLAKKLIVTYELSTCVVIETIDQVSKSTLITIGSTKSERRARSVWGSQVAESPNVGYTARLSDGIAVGVVVGVVNQRAVERAVVTLDLHNAPSVEVGVASQEINGHRRRI